MENKYLFVAVFVKHDEPNYIESHRIYGAPSHFHAKMTASKLAVSEKDLQGYELHNVEYIAKIEELTEGAIAKF